MYTTMGVLWSQSDRFRHWVEHAPARVDLTCPEQDAWTRRVADEMLELFTGDGALLQLEERNLDAPVLVRLAMKLARSKRLVTQWKSEVSLSIVYAVYKEHNRLRSRDEHPHGEDSLVRKVEQVEWLVDAAPLLRWNMLVVDDGCPESSGQIARQLIEAHELGDRVRVLFLEDAIDSGHPAVRGLASTTESQKGGSIEYGMAISTERQRPGHVVVYTDADLSTHLGQLGLLVEPIIDRGYDAAIGSRRDPLSVVLKSSARDARGKLFIYLWKRLIPQLSPIIDTQCGFKAFRGSVARIIVEDALEKRFAFDIELLLRTELARRGSIARVPIAWVDSEAASTTRELQPYLAMLHSIVRIARRYLPEDGRSTSFARLIESLDEAAWTRLANDVPTEIARRPPAELEDYDGISPDDFWRIALPTQNDHPRKR